MSHRVSRILNLFCLLTILAVLGYFSSYGSWKFLAPDKKGRGQIYDFLGESLKKGKTEVPKEILKEEAFTTKTGSQTYFGPLPSVLRIPLNTAFPSLFGHWSRASVFISGTLCALAIFVLIKTNIKKNPHLTENEKEFWKIVTTLSFCLGSPLVLVCASSAIYHEALLWGLAGCLWSMVFLNKPQITHNLLSGASCAALSLLARIPSGIPVALAQSVELLLLQKNSSPKITLTKKCLLATPLLFAVLITGWINTERFGNPWTFQDIKTYQGVLNPPNPWEKPHTALTHGNFHPARIPDTLAAYFLPDSNHIRHDMPPYISLEIRTPWNPKYFATGEPTLPLTFSSTLLLILPLLGLPYLKTLSWSQKALLFGFLLQWTIILCVWHTTQRYTADFIPALLLLTLLSLQYSPLLKNRLLKSLAILLLILNITTTLASTYAWTGDLFVIKSPKIPYKNNTGYWSWHGTPDSRKLQIQETLLKWRKPPKETPLDNTKKESDTNTLGVVNHNPQQIRSHTKNKKSQHKL